MGDSRLSVPGAVVYRDRHGQQLTGTALRRALREELEKLEREDAEGRGDQGMKDKGDKGSEVLIQFENEDDDPEGIAEVSEMAEHPDSSPTDGSELTSEGDGSEKGAEQSYRYTAIQQSSPFKWRAQVNILRS
uniref:Uncharacterized protein n=1 Tax=Spongospora subterranea TaxID=70186 RepID=A0A0H5R4B8_9EUKA|eukprot:CRZ09050.1 hypothetical protein [Spongospora subterranea]